MIPDKEQFEELCAAYALGALEEEERALFEEGLRNGGEEYKKIFVESIGVAYLLNSSVKKEIPSSSVKAMLMKKIHGSKKQFSSLAALLEHIALALGFGNPRFGFTVAVLLLILAFEVGTFAYLMYVETERHFTQQILNYNTHAELQQRLITLEHELDQKNEILNILQSPVLKVVVMNGLDVNPQGYGKIIWDPQRNFAILQVSKLPSSSADKDYQLWYLDQKKKPVSAGVFSLTEQQEHYFKIVELSPIERTKEITAFAITLEPKGGVPQPTGAMYLLGIPTTN